MKLVTSATDAEAKYGTFVKRQLGGTTIYAKSEALMARELQRLVTALLEACARFSCIDRGTVLHLVNEQLSTGVSDKLFGAVLGLQLRLGHIDSFVAAGSQGNHYRLLVHASNLEVFEANLDHILVRLHNAGALTIRDVQEYLFPDLGWGTWSVSRHYLARLAAIGAVGYGKDNEFLYPEPLKNADR